MARNGSGQYNLINNSWFPAVNSVLATAADWEALIQDIAAALTQSVSKDGQTPMTGNLNMNGSKLTNLAAGTGTGQSLRWEQLFDQGTEADIASAATTDIGAQNSNFLRVTGTTTITSFGTNYRGPRFLRFAGAVTLTNGANLILPGGVNYTTTAGDVVIAIPKATSGTADGWYVVAPSILNSAVINGALTLNAGTANGVAYLNGSKVLTTGSALTFDGTTFESSIAGGTAFRATATTNTNNIRQQFVNAGGTFSVGLDSSTGSIFGAAYAGVMWHGGNYPLVFGVNNAEQMRLTSTGLGIGTSSPDRKLSVYTTDATGKIALFSNGNTNTNLYLSSDPTSGGAVINVSNNAASAALPLLIQGNGTTRATLDSFGNLGLGVTPSAWRSNPDKTLQINGTALTGYGNYAATLSNNAFLNASSSWRYIETGVQASRFGLENGGGFSWSIAPSGTAGNAISFTQALTLTAAQNLLLGGTSEPSGASKCIVIYNSTVPTSNVAGGTLFVENGALKYRGSSGTVTTLAPA